MNLRTLGNARIPAFTLLFFLLGCATGPLHGIDARGEKVYLGPLPVEETRAYQIFRTQAPIEKAKIQYVKERLRNASHLKFYRDGEWYDSQLAYTGAQWVHEHWFRHVKTARQFIEEAGARSEKTHKPYVIAYPDGTLHYSRDVLLNELEALEESLK